jgi:GLPGLI family protein
MKKSSLILTCLLLFTGNILFAQNAHFATSGTIEFNKTVNMYALIEKSINKDNEVWVRPSFDAFKKTHPQFSVFKSTLNFADNKMLFTPVKDDNATNGYFNSPMAGQKNTVYTDFNANQTIVQKQVFEQAFLVKDSTRKIKWKITDETRDILGYTCRRANGLIMDSIYVVAFYTDKIHVSGGPETFNGLPGMILEVAMPHENVIWVATKVTEINPSGINMAPPKKGKPVNNQQLKATLKEVMSDWGDDGPIYMKGFLF